MGRTISEGADQQTKYVPSLSEEATITAVDRMGMRIRARAGERLQGLRINFPREVRTPTEARIVLVEMVKDARARTAAA